VKKIHSPNKLHKLLFGIIISWTLTSCSSNNKNEASSVSIEKSIYTEEVLNSILSTKDKISEIYTTNSLLWLNDSLQLNPQGVLLFDALTNANAYGLVPESYKSSNLFDFKQSIYEKELKDRIELSAKFEKTLSELFLKLGHDLQVGIIDTTSYKYEFYSAKKIIDPLDLLKDNDQNNYEQLIALQPQTPEYQNLQNKLENYLTQHSFNDTSVLVPIFKDDSVTAYKIAAKALVIHDYLKDSTNNRDSILDALVKFQINNGLTPDSLIGKNTANALSENPYHNFLKAAVTLQKLRWEDQWAQPYILANIPGYTIRIRKDNKIILENRVVVGVIGKETPELDSELKRMIVYPFWNVPYSIKTEEIIPKMKKDSTYLQRNGYELIKGGKVQPYSSLSNSDIQTGNVPFSIRQKGGRSNALGVVKFIFPNKHSVYFHDTPSKRFFYNDIRAYSHGCVRVQNPLSLAEQILELDNSNYNIDTVKAFISRKERKTINLKTKIEVHIRYYTALANENGIFFYKDVYGRDEELLNIMSKLFEKTTQ